MRSPGAALYLAELMLVDRRETRLVLRKFSSLCAVRDCFARQIARGIPPRN